MNPMTFAMSMIMQNPSVIDTPEKRHMFEVLQSGDSRQGEQLANEILKQHGASRDETLAQAKKFFGI